MRILRELWRRLKAAAYLLLTGDFPFVEAVEDEAMALALRFHGVEVRMFGRAFEYYGCRFEQTPTSPRGIGLVDDKPIELSELEKLLNDQSLP